MAAGIRATGTKASCVYVDKDGGMPGCMKRAPHNRLRGMLGIALDEALPESDATWVVIDSNEGYALAMLYLQEKGGLTYKEARAVLLQTREAVWQLAEEWDVSGEAIYNLERRGEAKLKKAGIDSFEVICRFGLSLFEIDPEPA